MKLNDLKFLLDDLGLVSGSITITEPIRKEYTSKKAKVVDMDAEKRKPGALF